MNLYVARRLEAKEEESRDAKWEELSSYAMCLEPRFENQKTNREVVTVQKWTAATSQT